MSSVIASFRLCSTLKMDVAHSSKPFVRIYQTTECHIAEGHNLESLVLSRSAAEGYVFRGGAV
jgi:hypothetical protein